MPSRDDSPVPPRRVRPAAAGATLGSGLLLFAIALLLRVGYVTITAGPTAQPWSDADEYDTVAWNLANGAGFAMNGPSGPYATAFVPPVVPWITSLLYRAVGHHFFAALLLQAVIGALVPILLFALGSVTFGGNVGRLAGWLAALHPLLVIFSSNLLTETTFTGMLLLSLLAIVAWLKTPRPSRALGVGLLWGVTCLTRPTAIGLPLAVAAWAWKPLGLTVSGRDRVRQILMLFLGVLLAVGPWTLRNAVTLRAFVPVTTGGGRAFLDSNNPVVWGDPATRGGANSTYHLEPWASEFRGKSEPEIDALARNAAIRFLRGHVSEWPAMAAAKLGRFWRVTTEGGGTGHWLRGDSPLMGLLRYVDPLLLWSILTLPFALFGLVHAITGSRRRYLSLPFLVILYFTLGAIVFWGALRMRVPIEPLVLLYAAAGFEEARRRWLTRRRGLAVIAGQR